MGGFLEVASMKCITLRRPLVLFIVLVHCMMLFIIFTAIKMKHFQHASHGHSSISNGLNAVKTLRHSALAKKRKDTLRISDSHTSINKVANLTKTERKNEEADSSNKTAAKNMSGTENLPSTKPVVKPAVRPSKCNRCFNSTFPILMDQPHVCQSHNTQNQIDAVFFIESAVTHFQIRQAIRQTWATVTLNNTGSVRHVFMVGDTPNALHAKELREEGGKFQDVVMHGFHDSWANLTLKTLSSLRWVARQCRQSRFFMKVDDDMWINTPLVLGLLKNYSDFLQNGMGGHCPQRSRVIRNKSLKKWYVSKYLHPKPMYEPYCHGFAYLGSVNVAQQVVQVSPDIPFFHFEDVYVGMCLKRLGYKVHTFPYFKTFSSKETCKLALGSVVPIILNVSPKMMRNYWNGKCGKA